MNHEELLTKIEDIRNNYLLETTSELAWERLADATRALRAVVELHKPNQNQEGAICSECKLDATSLIYWPCPTIQTIERELDDRD